VPAQDPLTICSIDDLEHSGSWALARRSLGLSAFGLNVVDIAPGDSIPEHDETGRDQEEVFLTLSGTPTLVVDGESHALAQGTFARLDPAPRRTVRNDGDAPARVLIMSAPRTSGYEPMGWA
jgi:(S)-ureidoglycine aminohydrolase